MKDSKLKLSPISAQLFVLLTAVCQFVTACKTTIQNPSAVKIAGGEIVAQADPIRRSTVFLVIQLGGDDQQNEVFCTGTLIDVRTVITAAHCIDRTSIKSITVVFGPADTTAATGKASTWKIHPEYAKGGIFSSNGLSDLAIIKLVDPARGGASPAARIAKNEVIQNGEPLVIAGFGLTKDNQAEIDGFLRKATTTIALVSQERKELEHNGNGWWVTKGTCHGDSGGPAFVTRAGKLYLVGVTSRPANNSPPCGGKGIFTDLRYYAEWIDANL